MSTIQLCPTFGIKTPDSIACYYEAEHALLVVIDEEVPSGMYRISFDTLTLLFDPHDYYLLGIDAYTNRDGWERGPLTLLSIHIDAALVGLVSFDEHGIGGVPTGPVRYSYYGEKDVLRIEFSQGEVIRSVRTLNCLIYDLGPNDELLNLWLEKVNMKHLSRAARSEHAKLEKPLTEAEIGGWV